MNEYEKHAQDFLDEIGAKISIEFSHYGKHFQDDKEPRDIYKIILKKGARQFSFNFGQSINDSGFKLKMGSGKIENISVEDSNREKLLNSGIELRRYIRIKIKFDIVNTDQIILPKTPTFYSILACLTKYDPGTFENFCFEYGYDEDSRKAEKIYHSVREEWQNVAMLFNDKEIELLNEIQ